MIGNDLYRTRREECLCAYICHCRCCGNNGYHSGNQSSEAKISFLTVPGLVVSDLTRPDRNLYREHFRGADAVIHCGFVSAPNIDATTWQDKSDAKFWAEHANVALAYNVCRVALEEGVRRVVVCSSNHAADYYERLVWDGRLDMVTPEMPPRSYN